jgi:hypothetical protein
LKELNAHGVVKQQSGDHNFFGCHRLEKIQISFDRHEYDNELQSLNQMIRTLGALKLVVITNVVDYEDDNEMVKMMIKMVEMIQKYKNVSEYVVNRNNNLHVHIEQLSDTNFQEPFQARDVHEFYTIVEQTTYPIAPYIPSEEAKQPKRQKRDKDNWKKEIWKLINIDDDYHVCAHRMLNNAWGFHHLIEYAKLKRTSDRPNYMDVFDKYADNPHFQEMFLCFVLFARMGIILADSTHFMEDNDASILYGTRVAQYVRFIDSYRAHLESKDDTTVEKIMLWSKLYSRHYDQINGLLETGDADKMDKDVLMKSQMELWTGQQLMPSKPNKSHRPDQPDFWLHFCYMLYSYYCMGEKYRKICETVDAHGLAQDDVITPDVMAWMLENAESVSFETPEDLVVYRGEHQHSLLLNKRTSPKFLSTTFFESVTDIFLGGHEKTKIALNVPRGTPVLFVGACSQFMNEIELLIMRPVHLQRDDENRYDVKRKRKRTDTTLHQRETLARLQGAIDGTFPLHAKLTWLVNAFQETPTGTIEDVVGKMIAKNKNLGLDKKILKEVFVSRQYSNEQINAAASESVPPHKVKRILNDLRKYFAEQNKKRKENNE